jgi:tetratricopeptide (TPR) repeat protein
MTDITLRDYLKQLEDHIKEQRYEEAVAHRAQILERYPKNAAAYRALGRALMQLKRYDEAGEIFRRLLGAAPDDFAAHYQLSIVYDELKKPDEAIWHIERAFDQQSANKLVSDRLRSLYKKYRSHEVGKIQLTAGAVANQYITAGMHKQAIDLLERTVRKMPDRGDLRLKIARAQWNSGQHVDAAETALEVLKQYPYAVDANRILTELWLSEERPSDAQRYLSRIEEVDPYLAMQLATGSTPSADTFMVEELDFRRYAATLTASQSPDWLDSLDFENVEDAPVGEPPAQVQEAEADWLTDIAQASEPPAPRKKVTDNLRDLLPDEFDFPDSAGIDDTIDEADLADIPQPQISDGDDIDALLGMGTGESTGLTGLIGDDGDAWMDDLQSANDEPISSGLTGGLTGMLAKLGGEEEDTEDEDDDWLRELAASNVVSGSLNAESLEDILASTDDAGVDDLFADVADDSTGLEWLDEDSDAEIVPEGESDDPMAWLNEDSAEIEESTAEPDESMAWMKDTGIEFDDDAEVVPTLFDEDDPVTLESQRSSPMAWLQDSDVDFEDDMESEAEDTSNLRYYEEEQPVDVEKLDDPMAWLEDADAELQEEDIFAPDVEAEESDPGMSWLDDDSVLDEMLDLHDLTEDDSFAFESATDDDEPSDDLSDELEWQDEMTDQPNWNDDLPEDEESLDDLDWLSDDELIDTDDAVPAAEIEDDDAMAWLNEDDTDFDLEDEPVAMTQDDDAMAWLNEDDADVDMSAEADSEEWAGDLEGDFFEAEEEDDFDFEEELPAEPQRTSMLDFLNTDDSGDTDEDADWMGDIEVDEAFTESEADWLSDIGEPAEAIDEDEELDWLAEPEAETDFDNEEDELEPVAEADWLSDLDDAEADELEPVAEEMSDWGDDFEDDEETLEPDAETEKLREQDYA